MAESDFVVVGGGPGGIAAAIEAARAGVNVTLLDENERPGGQIYRQLEKGFRVTDSAALGNDYEKGLQLLRQFSSLDDRIRYWNNTQVWGIFKDRTLALARNGTSSSLGFKKLLLATGAYDRPVPFPGWTLPGVFTAGGAQRLVKTDRVLPGERILLAGTGPLQFVLAQQILKAGGGIAAILEAGDLSKNWLQGVKGIWGNWGYLKEGWGYLRQIRKAGVPLLRRHIILEARGQDRVREAVIAAVDENWRSRPGTERVVTVDAVCLGYGLVPSVELTLLAGCEHEYDLGLGGYVPVRNEDMETTVKDIYAVGDGAGVAGSRVALYEGRIAGLSVARSLGCISDSDARKHSKPFRRSLSRSTRFRKVLDQISMPRPGLSELAKHDTVICRCEEVTFGEIQEALAQDTAHIKDLKRMTRVGMGSCQGRMCGPAIIEIMRHRANAAPGGPGSLLPRPPIKPTALRILAGLDPDE